MHFGLRFLILATAGAGLVCLLVGLYGKGWVLYETPMHPKELNFDTNLIYKFGILNVSVCVSVVSNNTFCAYDPVEKVDLALVEAFHNGKNLCQQPLKCVHLILSRLVIHNGLCY